MTSCCLSASSLRFLVRPVPTEDFRFPCESPTQGIDLPETSLGFPRFACARYNWGGCLLYCGDGCPRLWKKDHRFRFPFITVRAVSMTWTNAASSKVQLPSSFQFSPDLVASFGLKLPSTVFLAFHLTVTSNAERSWRQPWTLGWKRLLHSTQATSCRTFLGPL
jgi:hypothetical protein